MDIHSIIQRHRGNSPDYGEGGSNSKKSHNPKEPTYSELPDLFFDSILPNYKLTRIEIMVTMFLYRKVWCRPNIYKTYGISQMMSLTEVSNTLNIELDEVYNSLRKLEEFGFITTVRSGQYFVRKYFLKEFDEEFSQTYDDFEV
ncbi:MAG: helix-turn-helix transcriptional regulator [Bacteriovoracaceae bacterium]|nr:helix-turn-helix transcriptional regulator [Bacteriovoracaceae bacterium]